MFYPTVGGGDGGLGGVGSVTGGIGGDKGATLAVTPERRRERRLLNTTTTPTAVNRTAAPTSQIISDKFRVAKPPGKSIRGRSFDSPVVITTSGAVRPYTCGSYINDAMAGGAVNVPSLTTLALYSYAWTPGESWYKEIIIPF